MKIKFIDIIKAIAAFILIIIIIVSFYLFGAFIADDMFTDNVQNEQNGSFEEVLEEISTKENLYTAYISSIQLDNTEIEASSLEVMKNQNEYYIYNSLPLNNEKSFCKISDNNFELYSNSTFNFLDIYGESYHLNYSSRIKNNILQLINSYFFTTLEQNDSQIILFTSNFDIIKQYYTNLLDISISEGDLTVLDAMGEITSSQMTINITYNENDISVYLNTSINSDENVLCIEESFALYSDKESIKNINTSFKQEALSVA